MQRPMPDLGPHLDDEQIEKYSLGELSGEELDACERHLLLCESCRGRVEQSDAYVRAMRDAAGRIRAGNKRRLGLASPWFIGLAAAAIAAFIWPAWAPHRKEPVAIAVNLVATRAPGIEARVPAGASLALQPDLTGLPALPAYRLEMVDRFGKRVWQGSHPGAVAPPAASGIYFIRIYSPQGTLYREYGLEVSNR